jgi:digeranylgeranylglycerophospholipid reductase
MYDIAIIGAGPGGSTAARFLAEQGLHVCLIDKEMFPRDKPCGGAFPLRLFDEFAYLKPRKLELVKCIGRMGVLHSPDRRTILKGKIPLAMTRRTEFDNVLLESAVETGVETNLETRVKNLHFNQEKVVIDTNHIRSISARAVIGADGVNSTVARVTGLNEKWLPGTLVVCRVAEIPITSSEIVEYYGDDCEYHFYSGSYEEKGYGWVFPKYNTVNVGLGIIDKAAYGLPRRFLGFVKLLQKEGLLKKSADLSSAKGGLVPIAGPIKSTVRDRCLLIGDASGMVNPLTGGGIQYAMETGKIAATILTHAVEQEKFDADFLIQYEKAWKNLLGHEFRIQLLCQKILTSPFASTLFKIGSLDREIQEMITSAMTENLDESIDIGYLIMRTAYVCLRQVLNPISSK